MTASADNTGRTPNASGRRVTPTDYQALDAFQLALRRFLALSESGAMELGLTSQQHQALLAVRAHRGPGEITIGELANTLMIKNHSAIGLVDRLVERDLLELHLLRFELREIEDVVEQREQRDLAGDGAQLVVERPLQTSGDHLIRLLGRAEVKKQDPNKQGDKGFKGAMATFDASRPIVAAMADPNPLVAGKGFALLQAAGIAVAAPLMAAEAEALNVGFVRRMRLGLPWVRLKMAGSLDGRSALVNGQSQWITGPEARSDGHRFRARAQAIITGVGTVVADDPLLTVRDVAAPTGQTGQPLPRTAPLRVVVDTHLQIGRAHV